MKGVPASVSAAVFPGTVGLAVTAAVSDAVEHVGAAAVIGTISPAVIDVVASDIVRPAVVSAAPKMGYDVAAAAPDTMG